MSDPSRVAERMVLTFADFGVGDLGRAVGSEKGRLSVVNNGILQ